MISMKIAKKLCPLCHYIIKVAHVDTIKIAREDNTEDFDEVKVRRYYCQHCKHTIQTVQRLKFKEEEQVVDMWPTGYRKNTIVEKVRQYESGKY